MAPHGVRLRIRRGRAPRIMRRMAPSSPHGRADGRPALEEGGMGDGGAPVGGAGELTELEERAMSTRLGTVVGPGGVGKTALARAAAERLAGRYALGLRVVDLTRVDDETVVPGAIANQLGFDSFDALLSSPND